MEENILEDAIGTQEKKPGNGAKIGMILGAIVLLALLVGAVIFLLNSDKTPVIRDIFIILLGAELFVIGITAVLLLLQTARLVNMFQHEIKPVLESANETIATLRGTTVFLSETMVSPVIKVSGYFASIKKALDMLKNITK